MKANFVYQGRECPAHWCARSGPHAHTIGALELRGETIENPEPYEPTVESSPEWRLAFGKVWATQRRSGKSYAMQVGRDRAVALGVHTHSVGPGFEICENFGSACVNLP